MADDKKLIKAVRINQRNPFKYIGGVFTFVTTQEGVKTEATKIKPLLSLEDKNIVDEWTNSKMPPSSIENGCKLSIYQDGRNKKAIIEPPYSFDIRKNKRDDQLTIYIGSSVETEEEMITNALKVLNKDYEQGTGVGLGQQVIPYRIIQEPWKDSPPQKRTDWGSGSYYLNNGCKLTITWISGDGFIVSNNKDDIEDAKVNSGKEVAYKRIELYPPAGDTQIKNATGTDTYYKFVTTQSDFKGRPELKYATDLNTNANQSITTYTVEEQNTQQVTFNAPLLPVEPLQYYDKVFPRTDDILIKNCISYLKDLGSRHPEHPDWKNFAENLALCNPDTETCSLVPFVNFLAPPETPRAGPLPESTPFGGTGGSGSTASGKLKIKIEGGTSIVSKDKNNNSINASKFDFETQAKTNFNIFFTIGDAPVEPIDENEIDIFDPVQGESEELDEEYAEETFSIENLTEELAYIEKDPVLSEMKQQTEKESEEVKKKSNGGSDDNKNTNNNSDSNSNKDEGNEDKVVVVEESTEGLFKGAKKGLPTNESYEATGYPSLVRDQNFANKYCGGVFPAKQHPDGTFVIAKSEGTGGGKGKKNTTPGSKDCCGKGCNDGLKCNRHWLVENPEYVAKMKSVKIETSSGTKTVKLHPEMASKVERAMIEIKKEGLGKYIESCAGGLAVRNVTNSLRLSNHSWGMALDVNTDRQGFKYGHKIDVANEKVKDDNGTRDFGEFEKGFVKLAAIMKKNGMTWLSNMDPMHFSIHE